MICLLYAAIFPGLIALAAGLALYIWALRNRGAGIRLAKIVGLIIIIVSALQILNLLYCEITLWSHVHSLPNTGMLQDGMEHRPGR